MVVMAVANRRFNLNEAHLRRLLKMQRIGPPRGPTVAAILSILLPREELDCAISVNDIARSKLPYFGSCLKNWCVAMAWLLSISAMKWLGSPGRTLQSARPRSPTLYRTGQSS